MTDQSTSQAAPVGRGGPRRELDALVELWQVRAKAPSIESPDSELVLLRCADELTAALARLEAAPSPQKEKDEDGLSRVEG